MNRNNTYLDLAFEHIGKSTSPELVAKMPLGVVARECERVASELEVVPPPSHFADRGLKRTRDLLKRAADIARGIDADPSRHLHIAAQHLNEDEIRTQLDLIFGSRR